MSRHFLGSRASITEARRFVSYLLKDWPVVEEAELIVSELATNAIRHTASGRFGGRFVVCVHAQPGQLWLGVMDEGGNGTPECATTATATAGSGS
jgi:anti-sigma regulatory factor (Ser/Thr protein kinase)